MLETWVKMFFEAAEDLVRRALGRLKIGMVITPTMSGTGIISTNLAFELARRNHEVHLLSIRKPFILRREENLHFHRVPEAPLYTIRSTPFTVTIAGKIVDIFKRERFDLVNVHYALPYSISAHLAKEICKAQGMTFPLITSVHGTDIHTFGRRKIYREAIAYALDQSDGITAVSKFLAKLVVKDFGISKSKVKVIYNFTYPDRFRPRSLPQLRRRFAKDGEKLILHVSNFRPVKRVDLALRAFALVAKRTKAKLLLLGHGPDFEKAKLLARKLGIARRVYFLGKQKRVERFYSIADLFLFTSKIESFGIPLIEAMASSVPVVAPRVGGIPEVVKHGRTGFLTSSDPGEIAEHCISILEDPELAKRMGELGREIVLKRFSVDVIIPRYIAYYKQILSKCGVAIGM